MLIRADESVLLIVDVQVRLAPVVQAPARCIDRIMRLVQAARLLDVPVRASEQYPDGLGPTVPEVRERLQGDEIVPKLAFSAAREERVRRSLEATGRRVVVVAGMEAHVCVLQTALGLQALGLQPYVVADACSARRSSDKDLALERLRADGVGVVSTEMVLFEWLERAGTPAFMAALPLIKPQDRDGEGT